MNVWIKGKLKQKGMRQKELADALGIANETLSRKIRGAEEFRYWEVVRICAILEIENPLPLFKSKRLSEMR